MSNRCAICQNYTFQSGKLARLGLGICKLGPKWEHPNPYCERKCDKFSQVPPEQMEARIKWEKQV